VCETKYLNSSHWLMGSVNSFLINLISGFHCASMLSVTFIDQVMHSIITVMDVKILLYTSLKDTH
jgi:hypothetical protein